MPLLAIEPLTPEWHQFRRRRITASQDVPAILGLGPDDGCFTTPLAVYTRLIEAEADGDEPPPKEESNDTLEWGNRTERMNAQWYEEDSGNKVLLHPGTCQHGTYKWLGGTPDGLITKNGLAVLLDGDLPRSAGVLEMKAPTIGGRKKYQAMEDGKAPLAGQVQLNLNLEMLDLDWGVLSAIVQPKRLEMELLRDQRLLEAIMETLTKWYSYHITRDMGPPEPTGLDIDRKALLKLYRELEHGSVKEMDLETRDAGLRLLEVRAQIRGLEKEKSELTNRVLGFAGEFQTLTDPEGEYTLRLSDQSREDHMVKGSSWRTIRKVKA